MITDIFFTYFSYLAMCFSLSRFLFVSTPPFLFRLLGFLCFISPYWSRSYIYSISINLYTDLTIMSLIVVTTTRTWNVLTSIIHLIFCIIVTYCLAPPCIIFPKLIFIVKFSFYKFTTHLEFLTCLPVFSVYYCFL